MLASRLRWLCRQVALCRRRRSRPRRSRLRRSSPAVSDCLDAIDAGAPLAHAGAPSNIAARIPFSHGDNDAAFANAAHVFKESSAHPSRRALLHGVPRVRRAATTPSRQLHGLYLLARLAPHQTHLYRPLDLNDNQLRVITPDVGGGFGPKGALLSGIPVRRGGGASSAGR